jgi:Family of unknown function (DUF5519)
LRAPLWFLWIDSVSSDETAPCCRCAYCILRVGHRWRYGGYCADLPFPRKVRDELIATGQAAVHPPLPNSGWVRRQIDGPADAEAVIALLRMNYDRARIRDEQRTTRQGDAAAGRRLEAIDNAGDRVMAPGEDFS